MILLDTHVLLWLSGADKQLGDEAMAQIRHAVNEGSAYVSAMSLWEIAMLQRRGRLAINRPLQEWWNTVTGVSGMQLVSIDSEIALDAGSLPPPLHGDPADRMIVATARVRKLTLVTADRAILRFASTGYLAAIAADQ